MQNTLFAILTNQQARRANVIEASLDQEFIVGIQWFNKDLE
jgi:hypothetical protein